VLKLPLSQSRTKDLLRNSYLEFTFKEIRNIKLPELNPLCCHIWGNVRGSSQALSKTDDDH